MGIEKLHSFDSHKFERTVANLTKHHAIPKDAFTQPPLADGVSEQDLLKVHTPEYLKSLDSSTVVARIVEVPPVAMLPRSIVNARVLLPFRLMTASTILAAKTALSPVPSESNHSPGWAINIGGGFHHCAADDSSGFCVYADINLAIAFAREAGLAKKVLIVDLDAHRGNGHAAIAIGDSDIFIMDVYNCEIFPGDAAYRSARSRIDLEYRIRCDTGDDEYLAIVQEGVNKAVAEFQPDLLIYNAGTDILAGDPLGALNVSAEGVVRRDELVVGAAVAASIPFIMVTSGGYQTSNAEVIANSVANMTSKFELMPKPPAPAESSKIKVAKKK